MSHRNSASRMIEKGQFALVPSLLGVRRIAPIQFTIIVLVLVLLITNGGAG